MANINRGLPSAQNQTLFTGTALAATAVGSTLTGLESYTMADFQLEVATSITGTTPTLDIYIQTLLPDNATWQDIAHFAQVTTAASHQILHFVTGASNVAAIQTVALAASTIKAFSLGGKIRVNAVVGGTNPSYPSVIVYGAFYE